MLGVSARDEIDRERHHFSMATGAKVMIMCEREKKTKPRIGEMSFVVNVNHVILNDQLLRRLSFSVFIFLCVPCTIVTVRLFRLLRC